jgi:hypothetical protein
MSAVEIPPPGDLLSSAEQAELSSKLTSVLEEYLHAHGKTWRAGLYLLVAFVWGWARRCGWPTTRLVSYADDSWSACSRLTNETQQPWQQAIVAAEGRR